jgi:hypothetical protein
MAGPEGPAFLVLVYLSVPERPQLEQVILMGLFFVKIGMISPQAEHRIFATGFCAAGGCLTGGGGGATTSGSS